MSTSTDTSNDLDWHDPTFRHFVTGAIREEVRQDGARRCLYVDDMSHDGVGYVPVLVTEDVAGYCPMTGDQPPASVWRWGPTIDDAREICIAVNREGLGIEPDDADHIVGSSMAAQEDQDDDEDEDDDR